MVSSTRPHAASLRGPNKTSPSSAPAARRPASAGRSSSAAADDLVPSTLGRSTSLSRRSALAPQPHHAPFLRAARRRSLAMSPWRRALDNMVSICVVGGVIAGFLTPAGHIALAVGLGLSWVTSAPDWANPEATGLRRLAGLSMGLSIALALGGTLAVILCGTGPVGWALSGLASAAVLTRLGLLAYTYRDRGAPQALRAAVFEFVGWRVPSAPRPRPPARAAAAAPPPGRSPGG